MAQVTPSLSCNSLRHYSSNAFVPLHLDQHWVQPCIWSTTLTAWLACSCSEPKPACMPGTAISTMRVMLASWCINNCLANRQPPYTLAWRCTCNSILLDDIQMQCETYLIPTWHNPHSISEQGCSAAVLHIITIDTHEQSGCSGTCW